jgi:hypothetical protein
MGSTLKHFMGLKLIEKTKKSIGIMRMAHFLEYHLPMIGHGVFINN